jgi:hypothetical protein
MILSKDLMLRFSPKGDVASRGHFSSFQISAMLMEMPLLYVRSTLALLLMVLSASFLLGEDSLVEGGSSPDGRYEIRIYKTGEEGAPSNYYYAVVNAKTGKIVQKLNEGGGFAVYEGALGMSHVLWHSSGDFFALTDHGSRHSMEMYVYQVASPQVTLLKTQDYFQNALGRVGATSVYATSVVKPLRWDILQESSLSACWGKGEPGLPILSRRCR